MFAERHYARSISVAACADGADADGAVADFALILDDTSGSTFARAKNFLSFARLFGPTRVAGADEALETVVTRLREAGFELVKDEGASAELGLAGGVGAGSAAAAVASEGQRSALLLLRPSLELLRAAAVREELDAWLREGPRAHGGAEFVPSAASLEHSAFTPARRVALAEPVLTEVCAAIRAELSRSHGGALALACPPFAVHDRAFNASLVRHLCRHWRLRAHQLHALRNVHGEKVAFHFAFATHYTAGLAAPAAAGVGIRLLKWVWPGAHAIAQPLFGLGISLWATAFLESWRLQQRELAALWRVEELCPARVGGHGVLPPNAPAERVRADFRGQRVLSRLTGAEELRDVRWRRSLKLCVTVPVLLTQLLLLTAIVFALYVAWIAIHLSPHYRLVKSALVTGLSLLWGCLVELLNFGLFMRLAVALNRWENYRTEREFERALVLKVSAFFFIDGFLWFFLLAFFHIPFGDTLWSVALHRADFDAETWRGALVTSVVSVLAVSCVWQPVAVVLPALLPPSAQLADARALRSGWRRFASWAMRVAQLTAAPAVVAPTAPTCADAASASDDADAASEPRSLSPCRCAFPTPPRPRPVAVAADAAAVPASAPSPPVLRSNSAPLSVFAAAHAAAYGAAAGGALQRAAPPFLAEQPSALLQPSAPGARAEAPPPFDRAPSRGDLASVGAAGPEPGVQHAPRTPQLAGGEDEERALVSQLPLRRRCRATSMCATAAEPLDAEPARPPPVRTRSRAAACSDSSCGEDDDDEDEEDDEEDDEVVGMPAGGVRDLEKAAARGRASARAGRAPPLSSGWFPRGVRGACAAGGGGAARGGACGAVGSELSSISLSLLSRLSTGGGTYQPLPRAGGVRASASADDVSVPSGGRASPPESPADRTPPRAAASRGAAHGTPSGLQQRGPRWRAAESPARARGAQDGTPPAPLPPPRAPPARRARPRRSTLQRLARAVVGLAWHGSALDEAARPPYDPFLDTARLVLQFGYATVFTVVWPLAPLLCMLCAAAEIRCAAVRLSTLSQRPIPVRVGGLGAGDSWALVLDFVAWASCLVNCAMLALATAQLDAFLPARPPGAAPRDDRFERLLVAVTAEHALLVLKWGVQAAAPDTPELLLDDARKVHAEFERKYGGATRAGGLSPTDRAVARLLPQLASVGGGGGGLGHAGALGARPTAIHGVSPASAPVRGGTVVTLAGEGFGRAVWRGQVTLWLSRGERPPSAAALPPHAIGTPIAPGSLAAVPVPAEFVSDFKLRCALPPAPHGAGMATLTIALRSEPPPAPVGTPCAGGAGGGASATEPRTPCVPGVPASHSGGNVGGGGGGGRGAHAGAHDVAGALPHGAAEAALCGSCGVAGGADAAGESRLSIGIRYYAPPLLQRLRPAKGGSGGGTPVRLLGARFADTSEITVRVVLHGVQMCVPGARISESEVRFLTPRFADAGTAVVQLSLNGQQFEEGELAYVYQHERCAIL